MAEIAPFRGIRYATAGPGTDLSARVAPPYDVLDQADKERMLAGDDRNIVALDLPHAPPKDLGPPAAYEKAGDTFRRWMENGTLVREEQPAIYVYHQTFEHAGTRYTRRKFFARLKLEPFDGGNVRAHEETFGGPKRDRLALMKATRANVSPVFALYRDPADGVGRAFAEQIERTPDVTAKLGGVENRLWVVTDEASIGRAVDVLADCAVYIADGHHRYNTSLNYRDWLSGQRGEVLAPDDAARFVLLVLGGMDDPGSLILPTHRVLVDIDDIPLDRLMSAWQAGCGECAADQADMTLHHGASGDAKHVRFTNRAVLAELEPDKSDAWRGLDVAYLHRYLFDELYGSSFGGSKPTVRFLKSEEGAKATAKREHGIALICKAPTMAQLCDVSDAGDLMPPKSTYFYPKVATGLVIHPLDD